MNSLVFFKENEEIDFLGVSNNATRTELNGVSYLTRSNNIEISNARVLENTSMLTKVDTYYFVNSSENSVVKLKGRSSCSKGSGNLTLDLEDGEGNGISPEEVEEITKLIDKIYHSILEFEREEFGENWWVVIFILQF